MIRIHYKLVEIKILKKYPAAKKPKFVKWN